MSKILQKAFTARARSDGRIPIRKNVTRGGKTFQQTFWVTPAQAKVQHQKAKEEFQKEGKGVFRELDAEERQDALYSISLSLGVGWANENEGKEAWSKHEFDRAEFAAEYADRMKDQHRIKRPGEAERMQMGDEDYLAVGQRAADAFLNRARQRGIYGPGGTRGDKFAEEAKKVFKGMRKEEKERNRPWEQQSFDLPEPNPPNPFPDRLDVDEFHLRSLGRFVTNSGDLYQEIRGPIEEAMAKKWKDNDFREKYMVDEILTKGLMNKAAMQYIQQLHPGLLPDSKQSPGYGRALLRAAETKFPTPLRTQLARDMAREFTKDLESGEWGEGGHRPRKKPGKLGKKSKMGKLAIGDHATRSRLQHGADTVGINLAFIEAAYAAPEGYTSSVSRTNSRGGQLNVTTKIKSEDGTSVGHMDRSLYLDEEGDLHAKHNLLRIKDEYQDTGLGTRMILNQFENYEQIGVKSVSLTTEWIGKYLWLKIGFRPDTGDENYLRRDISNFIDEADISDEQKSAVYQMLDGDLVNFARIKGLPEVPYDNPESGEVEMAPINKAALLHDSTSSWGGTIEVDGEDWGSTMEILNGYLDD